jgi:hypothetical protein
MNQCLRSALFSRTNLNQLQRQLNAWRQSQRPRTRLPDELWRAAAALAATHGVSYVAGHLRLEYNKLRRKLEFSWPRSTQMSSAAAPKGFVELPAIDWPGQAGHACTVELSDSGGQKMTLRMSGDMSVLVTLAEAFWRRRR